MDRCRRQLDQEGRSRVTQLTSRRKPTLTKKISPHSLRHTFATYKAERGVSPYVLREWLGHARLDTTQIYVHMARENSKKAMEATSL